MSHLTLPLNLLFLILTLYLSFTAGDLDFFTHSDYHADLIATNISIPRGLLIDEAGDILVLSRGASSIIALHQAQNDGSTYSQTLIVNGTGLGLNHGIEYRNQFLYASSGSTVYRWPYVPGQRSQIDNNLRETVISNISVPDENKVNTRTLIFDEDDLLYVTINSDIRLDNDSTRCRMRRFNLTGERDEGGIDFETGEVNSKYLCKYM